MKNLSDKFTVVCVYEDDEEAFIEALIIALRPNPPKSAATAATVTTLATLATPPKNDSTAPRRTRQAKEVPLCSKV